MTLNTVELPDFYLAGISVRTINADGHAGSDIGNLWHRFFEDGISNKISNKLSDDIYCMYTNYESDHTGYYTALLGCKTSAISYLPEGLTGKHVPAAIYRVYASEGNMIDGHLIKSVLKTWQEIWQSDLPRRYAADFEVYGDEAKNGDEGRVLTYVSIK